MVGRRRMNTQPRDQRCASTRMPPCRRSFTSRFSILSTITMVRARWAVDTHNAAACWNKALLDNAARPSGALVYAGTDGGALSPVQYERLKKEFADFYQGASNA